MYWPVIREVQEKIYRHANDMYEDEIPALISRISLVLYAFTIVTSILILMAFWYLAKQLRRVMFTFQLIPLGLVIENNIVKMKFIKLLRLNKNYF